jgi:hypothetical protein
MRPEEADAKFRDYMRLRHLALSTEQSYLHAEALSVPSPLETLTL